MRRDALTDQATRTLTVQARAVVNAAGPWAEQLLRRDMGVPAAQPTPAEAAAHLVSPTSLDTSHYIRSTPADTPETPARTGGRSPYVDFLGIHQQAQVDAGPVFRLPFQRDLIGNPMLPALHGGVLAGFGETAMILHLMDTVPGIPDAPRSVDFAIAYMRSAKPVDTFAQCTTVRQGNRVALAQVSIWQDDPQRPVANARGHFAIHQNGHIAARPHTAKIAVHR